MVDITKVGNTISTCRKDKGYTQDELASRLGVTPQAISKWERGVSLPDTDMLPDLAKMLDISVDELLKGVVLPKETIQKADDSSANINNLLLPAEISIDLSADLCIDNQSFIDGLVTSVALLRRELAYKYGFIFPMTRIKDEFSLTGGDYTISFRGKAFASGYIYKDLMFTVTDDLSLNGIQATDFHGLRILWMTEAERNCAGELQFHSGDKIIASQLSQLILQNPELIISRQMVKVIVNNLSEQHPVLVSEVIPAKIGYGMLRDVLVGILKGNKPINDMVTILETVDKLIDKENAPDNIIRELVGIL